MDDFTRTSALEPGKERVTMTRGGATSGNWEMGRDLMERIPIKTIRTDMTIARTGL